MRIEFRDNESDDLLTAWEDYYDGSADYWHPPAVPHRGDIVLINIRLVSTQFNVAKVVWHSQESVVCYVES